MSGNFEKNLKGNGIFHKMALGNGIRPILSMGAYQQPQNKRTVILPTFSSKVHLFAENVEFKLLR